MDMYIVHVHYTKYIEHVSVYEDWQAGGSILWMPRCARARGWGWLVACLGSSSAQAKAHKVAGTRFLGRGLPPLPVPTFPNNQPDRAQLTTTPTTCVSPLLPHHVWRRSAKWQVSIMYKGWAATKSAQTLGNPTTHASTPCIP